MRLPLVNLATRVLLWKATPARRSRSAVPEARAPLANKKLLVFLDVPEDLIEFMLLETLVPAQRNRLQPEFTRAPALFNMNVWRFKFIGKIEMEPVAILAQDCWHGALSEQRGPVSPRQTNTPSQPLTNCGRSLLRR